jgi:hypothetical protein
MHFLRLIGLFAIVALGVVVWAQGGRFYVNPRFGAAALVPDGWSAGPEPVNGDGRSFISPDGAATETIFGANRSGASIAEDIARLAAPLEGETVTYVKRGKKFAVVSGVKDGRIFYRKSLLSCGDTIWNSVAFDYPAARKEAFDALVARIAASLHGGGKACE